MRPPVRWAVVLFVSTAIGSGCGGGGGSDEIRFTGTYEGTISNLGPSNQPAQGSRRFRITLGRISEYSIFMGDRVVDSGTLPANADVSCKDVLTSGCSGSLSGTVTSGGLNGCSISGVFSENGAALFGTFSCPSNQGAVFNVRRV